LRASALGEGGPVSPSTDVCKLILGLSGVLALSLVFREWTPFSNAATAAFAFLIVVLLVAATARLWVAVATSVAAMLSFNFFFLPLAFLARHADRVLTHGAILKAIWGSNAVDQPEHLWVLMAQLRKKIEPDPSRPRYLLSEPWVGYRLVTDISA